MEDIITHLNQILIDITHIQDLKINKDIMVTQINDWSSLYHIQFIAAIENEFNIHFSFIEIQNWQSIDELATIIQRKIN